MNRASGRREKAKMPSSMSAPPSQTPIAPKVASPAVAVPVPRSTPIRERSTGPHVAKVEFIEEPKI